MFTVKTKDGRKYFDKISHIVYASRREIKEQMYITEFLIYIEPNENYYFPNGAWLWTESDKFIPE